uniref:Uncharacterized protein n=1 Tax=Tanacetum cinerariifolium TaxID=118510 RepID=A0A699IU28_TANCI|nr:hypothetical protein [Tanacetum cinerariifolium]
MNRNFYEPNLCYNSISSDFDQFQPLQFPVIHQPPQKMSIQDMEDPKQQHLDEMKSLINLEYRDEIKIDELKGNFNRMSIEINKKEKLQQLEQVANLSTYPSEFNPIHNEDLHSTLKNDRFNTKSYLLESLLNRDTLMASSLKFDSFVEEFFGELAHTDLIPSGINEANYDPEEDIHLVERLLYDNSSSRPRKIVTLKILMPNFACCGGLVESGLQERYGLTEMEEGVAGKGVQVLGGKW